MLDGRKLVVGGGMGKKLSSSMSMVVGLLVALVILDADLVGFLGSEFSMVVSSFMACR